MEQEMFAFFANGIRALIVDDDARFLKSASMLLPLLNFKVATCGSPSSALKFLTGDKIKDVDVVLVDAKKVATCGFDFRAIVEPDLRVPVIYFLSPNHEAAGDEADELLRTLRAATYILKKPLDADDVCGLWRVVAWRKCYLHFKASMGGGSSSAVNGGQGGGGGGLLPLLASYHADEGEEERVHFKTVRGVKDRKRKGRSNRVSSSGSSIAGGHPTKIQEQMDVTGMETDLQASHQQPAARKKNRSKKAKENGGNGSMSLQQPQAMDGQPQPQGSLFVQSVLQTLDVPPYNPKIFADGGGLTSNTAVSAPAPPPVYPAPAPHQVYQQQQTADKVFGNIAPPAEATTMATAVTGEQQLSGGNQQQQQVVDSPPLMFGPFPYQGPPPPVVQQGMFTPWPRGSGMPRSEIWNFKNPLQHPPAGDLVTGMASGATIAAAAAAADAGEFDNAASSLIQSLNLGAAQDDGGELAATMAMYTAVPDVGFAGNEEAAAMAELYNKNNYNNYSYNNNSAGSLVAPQVIGMDDPTMAGAFGGYSSASFVAPQGLGAAPNGNQLAVGDDLAAMFTFDQNEEGIMFPLDALLSLDVPMYDAGLDSQLQGGATAAAVAPADAAGTSLNGGVQGDMGNWDMGAADGLGVMDDNFLNISGDFLFPHDMNNGRE
ncbi:two-component response regulator ORR33-like [Phragmites australis]|uniref:two-component response regulator ORR33-like n=1 Tax=Phragmites australis TaxID=29695 RepID=UPI002D76939F|nr:two-component response regulator ORR33-like [Phragmites australis]